MFDWMRQAWAKTRSRPDSKIGHLMVPFGFDQIAVGNSLIDTMDGRWLPAVTISPKDATLADEDGSPLQGQAVPDGTIFLTFNKPADAYRLVNAILSSLMNVPEVEPAEAAND